MVADELKKEARDAFNKLNKAYQKNDLRAVRAILERLEQGEMLIPASDSLIDKKGLKLTIVEMREQLSEVMKEIDMLKQDETYQTILRIKDWDDYFAGIRSQLEAQIKTYKGELNMAVQNG